MKGCASTLQNVSSSFNTLRPRQNGRYFADDTFKLIFFNENVGISIKISLKFIIKGPINNIPAMVQIMVWRWSGHKPLSEPVMVSFMTHLCVTRPQWVNEQNNFCDELGSTSPQPPPQPPSYPCQHAHTVKPPYNFIIWSIIITLY